MQTADQINLAIAIISGVSTLTSLAVVFASFKALQASRETVALMRAQIRSANRPYIHVVPGVRIGSTVLMLTVRNTGASGAIKLRLSLDKDFYSNAEQIESRNLRKYTAFCQPIECFPPKAELSFHLGPGHAVFGNSALCPSQFKVSAEYEFEGERFAESTTIDIQPFMFSAQPIDPVAEQLEKLNQHASNIEKRMQ